MNEQHVLVTGATGFMGRHLLNFLMQKSGIRIWGISKNGGLVDSLRIDSLDLTSSSEVDRWRVDKPQFDAIFHLAAQVPGAFEGSQARDSFSANVKMVRNMLSLAEENRTAVIYASSTSVYGRTSDCRLSEDTKARPDNYYSLGKYVGELLCEIEGKGRNFPAISLRISAPYGPGQRTNTVINVFLHALLSAGDLILYGSGSRTQDFTFVSDAIQGLWLAYCRKKSGIYNIAGGQPISMKALAETVLSLMPDTSSKVRFSGEPDPQENYHGVFPIEDAKSELGYCPQVSLKSGLQIWLQALMEKIDANRITFGHSR